MRNNKAALTFVTTILTLTILFWLPPTQARAAKDNNPILLIHGMASSAEDWNELPKYLENRGWQVYTMDFSRWADLDYADLNIKDFRHIAAAIGREIAWIKGQTKAKKVNVIAHSIAGIAIRAYIAD